MARPGWLPLALVTKAFWGVQENVFTILTAGVSKLAAVMQDLNAIGPLSLVYARRSERRSSSCR